MQDFGLQHLFRMRSLRLLSLAGTIYYSFFPTYVFTFEMSVEINADRTEKNQVVVTFCQIVN